MYMYMYDMNDLTYRSSRLGDVAVLSKNIDASTAPKPCAVAKDPYSANGAVVSSLAVVGAVAASSATASATATTSGGHWQ